MAINIYTDGGCSGNPGPGGWAYLIIQKSVQGDEILVQKNGAEKYTTNNRMELMAVICALKAFYKNKKGIPLEAVVYTDSQYVQKGITEWIHKWKENNWRTSDKKPVKNKDLWEELDALTEAMNIKWKWVKGHAGNVYNERCDELTQEAIASL